MNRRYNWLKISRQGQACLGARKLFYTDRNKFIEYYDGLEFGSKEEKNLRNLRAICEIINPELFLEIPI